MVGRGHERTTPSALRFVDAWRWVTMPKQLQGRAMVYMSVPCSAFPNRHRARTVSDQSTREGSSLVAADCLVRQGAA